MPLTDETTCRKHYDLFVFGALISALKFAHIKYRRDDFMQQADIQAKNWETRYEFKQDVRCGCCASWFLGWDEYHSHDCKKQLELRIAAGGSKP